KAKSEGDANYVKLMKILMKSGIYHGLATHDEKIINQAKSFATRENIPRDAFEIQMLYGIRRDLQRRLAREGWCMRVYIPFGTEWYPYFMRRLAERPANVLFVAKICCGSKQCLLPDTEESSMRPWPLSATAALRSATR